MTFQALRERNIETEFSFSASRSSGPGGQNVNKVSTRAEIRFNVQKSNILSDTEKELITSKVGHRLTSESDLLTISQSERSQLKNKEKAIEKMLTLIAGALTVNPERIPTGPTNRSKTERIKRKRRRSETKSLRKGLDELPD